MKHEQLVIKSNMTMEDVIAHYRKFYDELYLSTFNDQQYVWRTLTQKEHRHIVEFAQDEFDAYERICSTTILYPEFDYRDGIIAYLPETLGKDILKESGYSHDTKEFDILNRYRGEMERFDKQAEVLIARAFPSITFEMMSTWTRTKLFEYLAKAEWSLQFIDGYKHIKLMSDEERYEEMLASMTEEELAELDDPPHLMSEDEMKAEAVKMVRQRGGDPMLELYKIYAKPEEEYLDYPMIGGQTQIDGMIGGHDFWNKKDVRDNGRFTELRESLQKVSARRRRCVSRRISVND